MNREDKIKTIWILYGIPASGKSTWAKTELMRNPGKYKRVNKDLLRLMLDNDKFDFQNEKFVLKIRDTIIESALNSGKDIIVDDTNFPVGGKHFKRMCEIAQKVGNVRVIERYFDVSLKDALSRNKNSGRISVPDDVIKNMFTKHVKGKLFTCQDVFFNKTEKISFRSELPDCIIFDIDGTLAHMNGKRSPFEWHKVNMDDPDENIIYLNSIVYGYQKNRDYVDSGEFKIIVMTGREDTALEKTKQWLSDVGVHYDELFIKKAGDNRKDTIVKREMYENYIKDKYNVICIFDDRSQVVEMWRSLGITCAQVAYGDF